MTDAERRGVLEVAGDLLLEEVKAALDFVTGGDVRRGLLATNTREHRLVSAALGDSRARRRLGLAEEAVQYSAGDIERAHGGALALLDEFTVAEPEWLAETIRAVAINAGLLGHEEGLMRAWQKLAEAEAELPDDLRRFVLEGFVRGFTATDADRAFEVVDAAYGLLDPGDASAVRRVQLARSEGQLVWHVSGTLGDGLTRQRVEAALATSRGLDLSKYVGELEALLQVDG